MRTWSVLGSRNVGRNEEQEHDEGRLSNVWLEINYRQGPLQISRRRSDAATGEPLMAARNVNFIVVSYFLRAG